MRLVLAASLLLLAPACSSSSSGDATPAASTVLGAQPADACSPGTMPAAGEAACVAVGTPSCPDGFQARADGWGCQALRPTTACTDLTRASLGSTSCVPVDDCSAAFPPAGATVVHDSAGLTAALASAKSGAVIALDEGTYDAIEVKSSVSLVGRCASKVKVATTGLRGILFQGNIKASASNLTIDGPKGAVVAAYGADVEMSKIAMTGSAYGVVSSGSKLRVSDSLLEGGVAGRGLLAALAETNGELTLSNVEVRGWSTSARGIDGGKASVQRSILSDTPDSKVSNTLVGAYSNGRVDVEESVITVLQTGGAIGVVGRELKNVTKDPNPQPGSLRFASSELVQETENDNWLFGAHEGGRVDVEGSTIVHRASTAFDVRDAETHVTLTHSVVTSTSQENVAHDAIDVFSGAHAELEGVALVSPSSVGAFVGDSGSALAFTHSLVTGMHSGAISVGVEADRQSSLTVTGSTFLASDGWAVLGYAGSVLEVDHALVDGMGRGVILGAEATLALHDSIVRACTDAAVTSVISTATVKGNVFTGNAEVVHTDGVTVVQTDNDSASPNDHEVVFSKNTLDGNASLVVDGHIYFPNQSN